MRRLRRSPAYKAARKNLSPGARIALWFAEDAIRGNPGEPGRTWINYSVPGYDAVLTVVENGDLLIAFHELYDGDLSLDLLLDRKDPPPWFRPDEPESK